MKRPELWRRLAALGAAAFLAAAGCGFLGGGSAETGISPEARAHRFVPEGAHLENLWDLAIKGGRVTQAWLVGDYVLVTTRHPNNVYQVRLKDGRTLGTWEIDSPIETAYPPEITADRIIVVTEDRLVCLDQRLKGISAVLSPGVAISARPVLRTWPSLYIPGYDGRLWSLSVRTIENTVESPLPGGSPLKIVRHVADRGWSARPVSSDAQITAPVAYADGILYFCPTDGRVTALRDTNGKEIFSLQTQGQVEKGVSLSGSRAYFGSTDYKLYCLDRVSGEKKWELPTGSPVIERPLPDPAARMVYAISQKRGLLGVEMVEIKEKEKDRERVKFEEPQERWCFKEVQSILGVGRRGLYVLDEDDRLVALDKKTGRPLWRSYLGDFRTVFPCNQQFEVAGTPLILLALTRDNEIVCLTEPALPAPED